MTWEGLVNINFFAIYQRDYQKVDLNPNKEMSIKEKTGDKRILKYELNFYTGIFENGKLLLEGSEINNKKYEEFYNHLVIVIFVDNIDVIDETYQLFKQVIRKLGARKSSTYYAYYPLNELYKIYYKNRFKQDAKRIPLDLTINKKIDDLELVTIKTYKEFCFALVRELGDRSYFADRNSLSNEYMNIQRFEFLKKSYFELIDKTKNYKELKETKSKLEKDYTNLLKDYEYKIEEAEKNRYKDLPESKKNEDLIKYFFKRTYTLEKIPTLDQLKSQICNRSKWQRKLKDMIFLTSLFKECEKRLNKTNLSKKTKNLILNTQKFCRSQLQNDQEIEKKRTGITYKNKPDFKTDYSNDEY